MSLKRKSKMTERFLEAGLNPKKEYLSLIVVVLVLSVFAILLYWYQRQIVGPISILLLMGGIDYLFLNKPKRILEKKKVSMESEFVHVFSYFSILIVDFAFLATTYLFAEVTTTLCFPTFNLAVLIFAIPF